jgi:hypothetical protein
LCKLKIAINLKTYILIFIKENYYILKFRIFLRKEG